MTNSPTNTAGDLVMDAEALDHPLGIPAPADYQSAVRERNAWIDSAMTFSQGESFYRDIVRQIGDMFGEAARTSDDGSVHDSVLALKVPELVQAALAASPAHATGAAMREALTELLTACEEDCGMPDEHDGDDEPVGASIDRPMALTFGMLRRARAALSSPAPEGESAQGMEPVAGDSGWIEWSGGEQPVPDNAEGLLRCEDGDVIYTTALGTFNYAHGSTGPHPGRRIVAYRLLSALAPPSVKQEEAGRG